MVKLSDIYGRGFKFRRTPSPIDYDKFHAPDADRFGHAATFDAERDNFNPIIPFQGGLQNALQNELRSNWPKTTGQLDLDYTPVLQDPLTGFATAIAKSAPMMYGVYPSLAALAARSLYNNYYASGGKTKKRSQRKRQTRKRQ